MQKKTIITSAALLALCVCVFYINKPLIQTGILTLVKSAQDFRERHGSIAEGIRQEIFSAPLKEGGDFKNASLSRSGVISITNYERLHVNLPALKENALLDA